MVVGPYVGVLVAQVVFYEFHLLIAAMKHHAALQVAGQSAEPFHPTVESWLKLCPGGHRHLYAAQGVERLLESDEDNLPVQSVVEALCELTPEFW